jgi:hypothetical protein
MTGLTQIRRTPDSSPEEAVSDRPAESHSEPCTFRLRVDGVEYCFTASPLYEGEVNRYRMKARAVNGGADAIEYVGEVWVAMPNGIRSTKDVTPIILTNPKTRTRIQVSPSALFQAWNDQTPKAPVWDFVILEIYDEEKINLPIYVVYWMTGDWYKPLDVPAKEASSATVATFRVASKSLPPGYVSNKAASNLEKLKQPQVRNLIAGKSPLYSATGFDTNTYVGMKVRSEMVDIRGNDDKVPWDEGAGKMSQATEAKNEELWVSLAIHAPPSIVKANFKSNASDVPDGLASDALAEFHNEVILVLLYLQQASDVDIEIHAHTDTVGGSDSNDRLSQLRAESTARYLTDASIWSGIDGKPKALELRRITIIKGEGQANAEKDLREKHPKDFKQFIKSGVSDVNFRVVEIKYKVR